MRPGIFIIVGFLFLFAAPLYSAESKKNKKNSSKASAALVRSASGKRVWDPLRRLKSSLPWIDFTGGRIGDFGGEDDGAVDGTGSEENSSRDVSGSHGGSASGLSGTVSGANSGGGTSAGTGGSGASSGGNSSMNENATAGNKVDPGARGDGGGGNKGGGNSGGDVPPGLQGVTLQRWYAMCLFIDPKTSGDVNAAVKKMVDDAARVCGVYIHVVPRTAKEGSFNPADDTGINQLQTDKCNIKEGLGIPAASTSFCSSDQDVAAKMCDSPLIVNGQQVGWDRNVAGCGQIQKAGGGGIVESDFGGSGLTTYSGGGAAPSIERQGACTGDTIAHEALGHGQMGEPNGPRFGKGIGKPLPEDPQQNNGDEGEGSGSGDWTPAGCASMNSNSFPNTRNFKWYPDKKLYYKLETNPERQFDMQGPYKVFRGPAGDPTPPGGNSKPPQMAEVPVDNRVPTNMRGNSGVPERPASGGGSSGTIAQSGQADPHKKPNGGTGSTVPAGRTPDADIESMMGRVNSSLNFERANGADPKDPMLQGRANPSSGAASTSTYGYNEDATVGSRSNPLSTGSGPASASSTTFGGASGGSSSGGGGIASGDGISDGAPTGANRGPASGDREGDSSTSSDSRTDLDANFFRNKKRKTGKDNWRGDRRGSSLRSGGSTLRNPAQQGSQLYQSGSVGN